MRSSMPERMPITKAASRASRKAMKKMAGAKTLLPVYVVAMAGERLQEGALGRRVGLSARRGEGGQGRTRLVRARTEVCLYPAQSNQIGRQA